MATHERMNPVRGLVTHLENPRVARKEEFKENEVMSVLTNCHIVEDAVCGTWLAPAALQGETLPAQPRPGRYFFRLSAIEVKATRVRLVNMPGRRPRRRPLGGWSTMSARPTSSTRTLLSGRTPPLRALRGAPPQDRQAAMSGLGRLTMVERLVYAVAPADWPHVITATFKLQWFCRRPIQILSKVEWATHQLIGF